MAFGSRLASCTLPCSLVQLRSWMTAPMKFLKSATSPMLSALASLTMRSLHLGPQRCRNVRPRSRRALLPLVLERAAHQRHRERVGIGRRVGKDEVLAAGLRRRCAGRCGSWRCSRRCRATGSGTPRVDPVKCTPARCGLAMQAAPTGRPSPWTRLMTPGGNPRRLEQLHDLVRGEGPGSLPPSTPPCCPGAPARSAGLPAMAVKCERRHREDEALERSQLERVRGPRRRERLLGELAGKMDIEAEKVDQLAGRVDLRLVRGLALAEHGRRRSASPATARRASRRRAGRCVRGRRRASSPSRGQLSARRRSPARSPPRSPSARALAPGDDRARRAHVEGRPPRATACRRCDAEARRDAHSSVSSASFKLARSGECGA